MIEVAEPETTPEAERGLWRYVRMEHSVRGKVLARELLEALPTARAEPWSDGYRVWAAACDLPRAAAMPMPTDPPDNPGGG